MSGWQCPKCGFCYSPFVTECSYCNRGTGGVASTNIPLAPFVQGPGRQELPVMTTSTNVLPGVIEWTTLEHYGQ